MGKTLFPETVAVRLRSGWRARIDRLADARVTTASDWLRAAIERAVESGERQERQRRQDEREARPMSAETRVRWSRRWWGTAAWAASPGTDPDDLLATVERDPLEPGAWRLASMSAPVRLGFADRAEAEAALEEVYGSPETVDDVGLQEPPLHHADALRRAAAALREAGAVEAAGIIERDLLPDEERHEDEEAST